MSDHHLLFLIVLHIIFTFQKKCILTAHKNDNIYYHYFSQIAFKRIKRLARSHEAAMQELKKQEKEALRQLEQLAKTGCRLINYIDFVRTMQKIPKE